LGDRVSLALVGVFEADNFVSLETGLCLDTQRFGQNQAVLNFAGGEGEPTHDGRQYQNSQPKEKRCPFFHGLTSFHNNEG
jgi:hypothetical protein